MTPRIIDIAKAANVSPSAVSLALNNKAGVSAEVRQKIAVIAAEMGYKVSAIVEAGAANKNITIRMLKIAKHGRIINEHHSAFITGYMEGIEAGAKKLNYKLQVSFFDKIPIEDIVEYQRNTLADGLIVLGTELNAHELTFFTTLPQPVVFIDTYFPLSIYDCIDMDNVDGVFKAIHHLYTKGHRNIGMVWSNLETRNFKVREQGFREVMEYFSLPIQERFLISVDPAFDQSIVNMNKFLDKTNSLPSAFFCLNDILAYGCLKALRDHNIRVPEDVSIIGFDDLPSSSFADPPLTTIRVSTQQIGQRALERLAQRISGDSCELPENILISGKLITRGSVKQL
jgi:LacI family transcriptional regulator